MAASMDEVEVIIIKPDKMFNSWSGMLKLCALMIIVFALYIYVYIYFRALILKYKQLQHIRTLTIKSEKMMEHIFVVDKNISISLEELRDMAYS